VVSDQIGTPTCAASVAAATWAIAARLEVQGVAHGTDDGVASWYDFAVAIRQESIDAGLLARPAEIVPIPTSEYPTPACRPRYSVLDCSATRAALGLTPEHWRAALRRTLGELADG
jgi:dTDP-4-dehydrorhamnose reductase